MSESTAPSVPKKTKQQTVSSQKKQNQRIIFILTLVEIIIIAGISIATAIMVHGLSVYDSYYQLYYAFPISGVVMIGVLIIAYFKKWLPLQLFSVIVVLVWSTYGGGIIYSCWLLTRVKKMEAPYMNAEMYVVFDGRVYTWEGKTIIYGLPAEWENLESRAKITSRDDSKVPDQELTSKGVNAGCEIFYQNGYKYILVEVVPGSLFEFIDPDDPPEDTVSTATTTLGIGI